MKNDPRANNLLIRALWSVSVVFLLMLFSWMILIPCFKILLYCFFSFEISTLSWKDRWQFVFDPVRMGKVIFYFTGSVSVLFWNMTNLYNRKWEYCCNLYNDILKIKIDTDKESKGSEPDRRKDILNNTLAIDLLKLDFWAHSSFWEVFSQEIDYSIDEKCCEGDKVMLRRKVANGELSETEAQELLITRHYRLVREINGDDEKPDAAVDKPSSP